MSAIIAHRGASGMAPENTLPAIHLAAAQGASWVELDVMLSADGVPVLAHDPVLSYLPLPLRVKNLSWKSLQQIQVPAPAGSRQAAAPLTSLAAAVAAVHQQGMGLNLEIKPATKKLGAVTLERSLEVLSQSPPVKVVISSFNLTALKAAQIMAPNVPRALLLERLPKNWLDLVTDYAVSAVHLSTAGITARTVAQIRAQGLEVYVYTVNDPKQAQKLFAWGVKGVFTDFPYRLLQAPKLIQRPVGAFGLPVTTAG